MRAQGRRGRGGFPRRQRAPLALRLRARPQEPVRRERAGRRGLRGRRLPLASAQRGRALADRHQPRATTRAGPTGSSRWAARSPRYAPGASSDGRVDEETVEVDDEVEVDCEALACPACGLHARRPRALLRQLRHAAGPARIGAAGGAAQRGPRPGAQDRSPLHRGRAGARGRRAQPGRGGADPGTSCSRRGSRACCAAARASTFPTSWPPVPATCWSRRPAWSQRARLLGQTGLAPQEGDVARPSPLKLVAVIGLGGAGAALVAWLLQGGWSRGRLPLHGFRPVGPRRRPPRARPRVHGGARRSGRERGARGAGR